jgi:soluble lytic murein transglycosylase-like protein
MWDATELGFTPQSLYDPAINIIAGTRYLKYLIGRFRSVRAGLVVYNGGEGNFAVLGEDARSLFRSRQYADRILACANQIKPAPFFRKR